MKLAAAATTVSNTRVKMNCVGPEFRIHDIVVSEYMNSSRTTQPVGHLPPTPVKPVPLPLDLDIVPQADAPPLSRLRNAVANESWCVAPGLLWGVEGRLLWGNQIAY